MPAFDQIWPFLTGAVMAGLVVGAILTRILSDRHAHYNDVRWRRRFNESQAEHELRIATLTKTLDHSREKQVTLRQALDESDETIRLYSDEGASPFEADIAERNTVIADLRKTVSHSRAMVADAQDHELALQGKFERLQTELAQRVSEINGLEDQVADYSNQDTDKHDYENQLTKLQTELSSTQETLLDSKQQLADLTGQLTAHESKLSIGASKANDQEQQLTELTGQLAEYKSKLSIGASEAKDQEQQLTELTGQLAGYESKLSVAGSEVEDREQQLTELTGQLADYKSKLSIGASKAKDQERQLTGQLTDYESKLSVAGSEVEDRERQLAELTGQVTDYESKLSIGAAEAKDQDRRIAALVEQIKDLRELLPKLNQSIGEHETVMASVVAELSVQREKTLALQQKLKQDETTALRTEETPEFSTKVVSIHKHLLSDDLLQPHSIESPDDSEKRVRRLESELREWKDKYEAVNGNTRFPTPELPAGALDSKDDLKQINGIGPVLESALNELGFYQFEQIAGMEQGDIEKMGRYDRTLPGRIRRYNWVEQARELHQSAQADGHSEA